MTCAAYEPLIALYVENDLSPHESEGVKVHLAECAACRTFAADLADSQRALHELAQEEVDPRALAAVRQRVTAALPTHGPRTSPAMVWTFAAAAAVAVMAILLQWRDRGAATPTPPSVAERPIAPAAPSATPRVVPSPPSARVVQAPELPSRQTGMRPRRALRLQGPAASRAAVRAVEPQLVPSPLVIKLVTSDPDIVIYWLVEQNGGRS